ncbi:MAG: 6-carboxytetrahydropterin synthase [bacterium]
MFEISVKKSFSASHALTGKKDLIEKAHDHRFECEVKIISKTLGEGGMGVDFRRVDEALDAIVGPIEGKSLNESRLLAEKSPSAENIALAIFNMLGEMLPQEALLKSVTIWEDADHSATYYGER